MLRADVVATVMLAAAGHNEPLTIHGAGVVVAVSGACAAVALENGRVYSIAIAGTTRLRPGARVRISGEPTFDTECRTGQSLAVRYIEYLIDAAPETR